MKKLRFLVSLTTNDNDYQIEQAQSAEQMARKLGAEVQIVYADNDAITQSTQILKAIQVAEDKRPDAVVFEPVGGTALPQVARAAASVGIGWAVLNRDASYIPEMRKSSSAPIFEVSSISKLAGSRAVSLQLSYPMAVRSSIFKDRRRIPRPRSVPSGCRRRNHPTFTSPRCERNGPRRAPSEPSVPG